MKKILILAALIAAPLTAPLAAHAQAPKSQEIRVSTAGLDLRNPADASELVRRIEAAVRPVCVAPGVATRTTTAGCIRKITEDTIKNLSIPELNLAFERAAPGRSLSRG